MPDTARSSRSAPACQSQVANLEAQLGAQSAAAETERTRLTADLAARERALVEARQRGSGDARRVAELQEAAELRQAEHSTQMAQLDAELAAQIAQLKSEAETRDSELAVLMAHLQEARRPIQPIEADVKRLTEELAAKNAACAQLDEEKPQPAGDAGADPRCARGARIPHPPAGTQRKQ